MLYIFLIGVRGFFFVSGDKQKDREKIGPDAAGSKDGDWPLSADVPH